VEADNWGLYTKRGIILGNVLGDSRWQGLILGGVFCVETNKNCHLKETQRIKMFNPLETRGVCLKI